MSEITRREFIAQAGILGASVLLFNGCGLQSKPNIELPAKGVVLGPPLNNENIFAYIQRLKGNFDLTLYRQIIGAANDFKEGDLTLGVAAENMETRVHARTLLAHTKVGELMRQVVFEDAISELIQKTSEQNPQVQAWTLGELKAFILEREEAEGKAIMPSLSSDIIACAVKLMSNEELINVGQKVLNPLPNSEIGAKDYMSARVQHNSPTDNH